MCSSLLRFASGIVLGAALLAGEADAQICAAPATLAVNQPTWIDTCFSDYTLAVWLPSLPT